jgi:hypothetical protein
MAATWKKIIVSGSNAELNQITASGGINATLPSLQQTNFVSYNSASGQLGYFGTGSLTAATASYVTSSNVYGPYGANSILSASYATTASFVTQAVSSSFATTASYVQNAQTASYVLNAVSSSFASTASYVQNAQTAATASTVTVTDTTIGGTYFLAFTTGSSGAQTLRVDSNGPTINASQNSISASSFTGSLQGTATSASYVLNAVSSSFASTASYVQNAQTASYVLNAVSASFAALAQTANTASYVQTAQTASYVNGNIFTSSNPVTSASYAASVNNLTNAITNNVNNYILTATGSGTINGEGNLQFDGSTLTVTGNAVIANNLTVQGTASFQNTENLLVADRFVLFASGSNTAGDGGIVVQQATQNVGELYGYESTINRWGFTSSFNAGTSSFTPAAYITTTETGTPVPSAAPIYGGSGTGFGNIYVKTDTGDIYIYA